MAQWRDIAGALREEITRSDMAVGQQLPTERVLAERFSVARNTVRRAIGALVDDGIIVRQVGSGTYVQAAPPPPAADLLARIIGVSPRDLMEVRMLLEPRAAALAAVHANAEELAQIAEAHAAASAAREISAFEAWDAAFHRRVFAAAHNELLMHLCDLMGEIRTRNPWLDLKKRAFSEARRSRYCAEHGRLADALARRNATGAEAAMRDHLDSVRANLFAADS